MLLKIHPQYGLPKLGVNLEYVSTFVKGKNVKNPNIMDWRFVFKNPLTQEKYILWLGEHFMIGFHLECIEPGDIKIVSPTHYKHKTYNYYHHSNNVSTVEDVLKKIKDNRKLVPVGNGRFEPVGNLMNFKYAYEFNNNLY